MAWYSSATINGITYNRGDYVQLNYTGHAGSADGTGYSTTDRTGKDHYFYGQFYTSAYTVQYPYHVGIESGKADGKYYTAAAFPYATYTVSYNANGGSGAPSSQTKTYNTTLTLSSTVPTRSGYDFLGWATSQSNANAGSIAYYAGGSYTANSGVTLYAVWGANSSVITFDANGGTNAPDAHVKPSGQSITLTIEVPTREKYLFYQWNTKPDGTGTSYASGSTYSTDGNMTLYAIWNVDKDAYTPSKIESVDAYVDGGVLYAVVNTSDPYIDEVEWYVSNSPHTDGDIVQGQSGLQLTTNVDVDFGDVYVRAYAVSRYGIKAQSSDSVRAACRGAYRFKVNVASTIRGIKFKAENENSKLKFYVPMDNIYPDASSYPNSTLYPEDV